MDARIYVQTLFCDDIRYEINGKTSYIGAYNGSCLFESLPAKLQKLCIMAKVVCPLDFRWEKLVLRVFNEEATLGQIEVDGPSPELRTQLPEDSSGRIFQIGGHFVLNDMAVEKDMVIRVRARFDDGEEARGPGLQLRAASRGEMSGVVQPSHSPTDEAHNAYP